MLFKSITLKNYHKEEEHMEKMFEVVTNNKRIGIFNTRKEAMENMVTTVKLLAQQQQGEYRYSLKGATVKPSVGKPIEFAINPVLVEEA